MLKKTTVILLFSIIYTSSFSQNLYDAKTIKEIRLIFPNGDWSNFMDSVKKAGKDARLKGTMQLDGQIYANVGVRYKGNSSYFGTKKKGLIKLPLNIKLDKKQKINSRYETLKLSNINRDASYIREALSYEIVRTYMPAPQCNFAKVYVNDKMLGLYNNVEAISEKFLKNHYETSTPKGTEIASKSPNPKDEDMWLVKCDPEWTAEEPKNCPKSDKASLMYLGEDSTCYQSLYEMDKEGNWGEFIHFIKILNQEPDKIERYLNVDQTLWMLALNNVMVNLDSYSGLFCHNYYLLRGADGRFTPLIWDLNMSFGGFAFDGLNAAPLSTEPLQTLSPMLHSDNAKRPLIAHVSKNLCCTYQNHFK
jgi:spore coat protein CotH